MKRVLNIAKRDIKSSFRDYMVLYIMIAPLIIAFILTFFIPSAESATFNIAIDSSIESELIEEFEKYSSVEIFNNKNRVSDRVLGIDDVIGLTKTNGEYEIITEGNEEVEYIELPQIIINKYLSEKAGVEKNIINVSFSDIGYEDSPVAVIGGISVIIMCIVLAGMIVGLNIVEEKESSTISAINVSPMNKAEFIIGKSLLGCIIALIQVFLVLLILGFKDFDLAITLIFTLINLVIVVLFGFITGVTSSNQMTAIANIKVLFLPVSVSIVGAILLPQSKHFFLYWSPFYWMYRGYFDIIKNTAVWTNIGVFSVWILGITTLLILALKNKIAVRLN